MRINLILWCSTLLLASSTSVSGAESMHSHSTPPPMNSPPCDHSMHICAFHIAKDNPNIIIETQHYCMALSDNLFQCILYDTTDKGVKPKLIGVEYVIGEDLYRTLDPEEKLLWHPHEYEIRQGLLATVDIPEAEEQKVMKALLKTWGKTWHTWPNPKTDLPVGKPMLMWSATKPGQIPDAMIQARDRRWDLDTAKLKKERESYLP